MNLKRSAKMIITVQCQCTCGWRSSPYEGKDARPKATSEYIKHVCIAAEEIS